MPPSPASTVVQRRIAFIPYDEVNKSNAYAFRMRDILARFGTVETFEGVKATIRRRLAFAPRRYDAIVVSWVENDLIDPVTHRFSIARAAKLFAKAALMRMAASRTVFVRHNNYPHATIAGQERRLMRWVDRFERMHGVSLTHSGAAAVHGRRYVPHPLYARAEATPTAPFALPDDYFVAFGMMFPYKHLAELIAAFPDDRTLLVVGAIGDADYAQRLVSMQRTNVIVRPGFLDEGAAQAIVSGSQAVLIVHADADVVVSGSFFYAMSLSTPVIAVRTPFLEWVAGRVPATLLTVVDDIADVAKHVRLQAGAANRASDVQAIDREFGDDAVVRALSTVLWQPHGDVAGQRAA